MARELTSDCSLRMFLRDEGPRYGRELAMIGLQLALSLFRRTLTTGSLTA